MRACEQRVLQDAPGRGIDADGNLIDRCGRRVRFQIEQRQRAQGSHVANGRRQLQAADMNGLRHQPEAHAQDGGGAIAALEPCRQRLEQPREHERQRLEPLDRPFQIDRRFERFFRNRRHQRPRVVAARDRLPGEPLGSQAGRKIGGRQRRELAECFDTPRSKYR